MCKTQKWDKATVESFGQCLGNKDIYFLGDSTSRQWAYQLLAFLGAPVSLSKTKTAMYKHKRHFDQFNLTITFQFHPQILGSGIVDLRDEMYEVDLIDSLQNTDCNYVVLVSPWAHFSQWFYPAYVERLHLLKASIKRLRDRCPGVPIIVKSPHVRDHKDAFTQLLSSDYTIYRAKQALEEVFRDAGVYYINVWDINNAFPGQKTVHMPLTVVNQELSILLSYLCPSVMPKLKPRPTLPKTRA